MITQNNHTYRLARESVNKLGNIFIRHTISLENTAADTNSVFSSWSPVELLHTPITDEGSIKGRKIVTSDDNGDTRVLFLVVHSWELNIGGVVSNVHESRVNHLVVDSVLGGSAHSSCSCIEIVDEEAAHLTLFDDVCGFTVSLPD
ncbi:hypothetical protein Hanom_Chr09g00799661 [Helianthus anomalus]